MRHLRADYDAIQPWPVKRPHIAKTAPGPSGRSVTYTVPEGASEMGVKPLIPDDEPVFLLRGQDPAAAAAVRAYAHAWVEAGGDVDVADRILDWASEMQEYAKVKQHGTPDVPDGMLR